MEFWIIFEVLEKRLQDTPLEMRIWSLNRTFSLIWIEKHSCFVMFSPKISVENTTDRSNNIPEINHFYSDNISVIQPVDHLLIPKNLPF